MRATTRVGASICLSVFSLISIVLLLPTSRVSTQLQKITLGTTIDKLPSLWSWDESGEYDYGGEGVRLVVLGDSWVDDSEDGEQNGRCWVEVLCEEVNCTSHVNLAVSQRRGAASSTAPAGVLTSNAIYTSFLATSPSLESSANALLPDLAAQVQQFIALPPPSPYPKETLFIVSSGFWDVYNFAGLNYTVAQNITDRAIDELFRQLSILYLHYAQNLSFPPIDETSNITLPTRLPPFRVVIPKLFDATLLPGWMSQRPVPAKPGSVAEDQKNAVHLTARWNLLMENKFSTWIKEETIPIVDISLDMTAEEIANLPVVERDVFYYDLAQYLLDIIVENQLEEVGLSDASGLGNTNSPYESVYHPCLRRSDDGGDESDESQDLIVCEKPEGHLFWDDFNLGSAAKEGVGKEVGKMVKGGKSLREMWSKKQP